jgi:hypothetical protein
MINAWADFDTERTHRYSLGRRWTALDPNATGFTAEQLFDASRYLVVIGLNPSIADADRLDPTVTRCVERARRLGYGGLVMLNLFSLVSTDPRGLRVARYPDDASRNWRVVREWCTSPLAGLVLAAWGADPFAKVKAATVAGTLSSFGVTLHALGVTKEGAPRHPLYMPYSATPAPWSPPALAREGHRP